MLSLNAHWADKDFQQQQVLLHFRDARVPYANLAAASLAATFDGMLQRWGLDKNRAYVVL